MRMTLLQRYNILRIMNRKKSTEKKELTFWTTNFCRILRFGQIYIVQIWILLKSFAALFSKIHFPLQGCNIVNPNSIIISPTTHFFHSFCEKGLGIFYVAFIYAQNMP